MKKYRTFPSTKTKKTKFFSILVVEDDSDHFEQLPLGMRIVDDQVNSQVHSS